VGASNLLSARLVYAPRSAGHRLYVPELRSRYSSSRGMVLGEPPGRRPTRRRRKALARRVRTCVRMRTLKKTNKSQRDEKCEPLAISRNVRKQRGLASGKVGFCRCLFGRDAGIRTREWLANAAREQQPVSAEEPVKSGDFQQRPEGTSFRALALSCGLLHFRRHTSSTRPRRGTGPALRLAGSGRPFLPRSGKS
jgi:hypothetical protein